MVDGNTDGSAFKSTPPKVGDCEPSGSHDRNSIAPPAALRIMSAPGRGDVVVIVYVRGSVPDAACRDLECKAKRSIAKGIAITALTGVMRSHDLGRTHQTEAHICRIFALTLDESFVVKTPNRRSASVFCNVANLCNRTTDGSKSPVCFHSINFTSYRVCTCRLVTRATTTSPFLVSNNASAGRRLTPR